MNPASTGTPAYIHTQYQIAFTAGKNATDGFLTIDAMDLLHSG